MNWVLSAMLHALLFWLVWQYVPKPAVVFEASLISADSLDTPKKNTPTPEVSAATQKATERLAALEQEHTRALEEFARAQDSQIEQEFAEQRAQILAEQQAELERIQAFNDAQARADDEAQKNRENFEQSTNERNQAQAQPPAGNMNLQHGADNGSGNASAQNGADSAGNRDGAAHGAGSGINSGDVAAHIEKFWQVLPNSRGKKLSATVRVDDDGRVLSVSVDGSAEVALRQSLIDAIHKSSPITPLVGKGLNTLRLNFVAD